MRPFLYLGFWQLGRPEAKASGYAAYPVDEGRLRGLHASLHMQALAG